MGIPANPCRNTFGIAVCTVPHSIGTIAVAGWLLDRSIWSSNLSSTGNLRNYMVGSHHSTSSSHSVLYDGRQNYAGTQVDLNMTTTSIVRNTCMHIAMPVSLTHLNPNTMTTFPRQWRDLSGYNPQEKKRGMTAWKVMHMLLSKNWILYII